MKKSLKALAVLSLFGLGLGSVTACGGSSKSITISVNGAAVGANGVHVNELSTVTFSATIDGGAETDTVVWSTNSPSAFTFSATSGNEVIATANTPSTTGYVVSAALEGDASVTSSITVYIDEVTKTYELRVDTTNYDTEFEQGEVFTSDGLVVQVVEMAGDVEASVFELGSDEYTLSVAEGEVLDTIGVMDVTVTPTNTEYPTGTFKISVIEYQAYPMVEAINNLLDNGYVGLRAEDDGYLYSDFIKTPDAYFDYSSMVYYREESEGVHKYEIGATSEQTIAIRDLGPAYTNLQVETDLVGTIKYLKRSDSDFSEWEESYNNGMVTKTDANMGTTYELSEEAAQFVAHVYGYDQLTLDGMTILPVDRVEATFLNSTSDIVVFLVYLDLSSVGEGVQLGGIEYLSPLDESVTGLLTSLDAIIEVQDSTNFIPYDETYVDTTLSEFINDVAGADNVMNYGSGGLYLFSPTSRECRLINQTTGQLSGDVYGNGILDADSTITSDDGSSVEFNQGVVTYSISGQNLGFDQEDRFDGITSMEELGGKFSDAVLFSNDYLKYYNLEAVETTTTEDSAGNQYEAAQLRYGISGDTLDFVSALDEVNWAYTHSIPNGFEPFKIEITVTATFLDDTYENYTLQGEIYFYIKDVEDGGIYYIENFIVAENSSTQTYWDQYLAAEFTPVAA